MSPFVILGAGMAVVVGGILVFRLHAFLALLLGALVVGFLTTEDNIKAYVRQDAENKARQAGKAVNEAEVEAAAKKIWQQSVSARIAQGFGKTCEGIAILIALASIVGKCALDSGAADRIVRTSLRWLGEARAPLAFLVCGFVLGIPVFFDTVFLLMVPLGKAMTLRTGRNYVLFILSIGAGATITHSLVPPTPGPLVASELLHVNLGVMILMGCAVGAVATISGFAWALFINRRMEVPLRDAADISLEELKKLSARDDSELPPTWLALVPILLPVVLIGGAAVVEPPRGQPGWAPAWLEMVLTALGDKNIAIGLAAATSLGTLVWQRGTSSRELAQVVEQSLLGAGSIILITSAGGAFGGMLQQAGLGAGVGVGSAEPLWFIPLAFGVTCLIRTAQGSATVAMITAAGVFVSVASPEQLGFHPVYLAVAIGCGSKPISWMNDSGFWVICKMSGMTETEALSTWTPMSAIMGVTGMLTTLAFAWLWPLV